MQTNLRMNNIGMFQALFESFLHEWANKYFFKKYNVETIKMSNICIT